MHLQLCPFTTQNDDQRRTSNLSDHSVRALFKETINFQSENCLLESIFFGSHYFIKKCLMYKILQQAAVDSYCDYMLYLFSPLVVIRVLLRAVVEENDYVHHAAHLCSP